MSLALFSIHLPSHFSRAVLTRNTLILLALAVYLAMSTVAFAAPRPLQKGSYRCFTTTSVPQTPVDPRDPDWRKSQGLPGLERGERATPPLMAPGIMIIPAFFGNIAVDGKGGYRLTGSGHTGRYGFDAAAGIPTFTGDLKAMAVRGYNGSSGRFFLVYQSLAYECGLQGAVAPAPALAKAPTPAPAPRKPAKALTAADYTGRFVGNYFCNGAAKRMQLDTKASANGLIVAVETDSGIDVDGFSLVGKWTAQGFNLQPHEWIKRPNPKFEMTSFEGTLTENGMKGTMGHPICSSFELVRQ